MNPRCSCSFFFFFNDTATTEIYTLSLHDALPILVSLEEATAGLNIETLATLTNKEVEVLKTSVANQGMYITRSQIAQQSGMADRKSTRLNSSHQIISYAVFCLKKKKIKQYTR